MVITTSLLLTGLFFAFLMLVVIGRAVRRRNDGKLKDPPLHTDFSVADLHQLAAAGKLTPEEFERAKAAVLRRGPQEPLSPARGFRVVQAPPPLPPERPAE